MIDVNAILAAALKQAIADATAPMMERIQQLEEVCRNQELLFKHHRELIKDLELRDSSGSGLTREEVREIADEAIEAHCEDHDHDPLSDMDSAITSALNGVDLSDHFDVEDVVRDALRSMSFEVSIS